MGSNSSKSNITDSTIKDAKDVGDSSDPRSPTPEITRTPLQNKNGTKHNITKNVDLRKTFEEDSIDGKIIHNNPILSAVIKNHLQTYDPRSPTQDFERTPIVITSKVKEVKNYGSPSIIEHDINHSLDLQDKHVSTMVAPKNLCNGFLDSSLDDTAPLGSSTASSDSISKNMSAEKPEKPQKLLETNFDYFETSEKEQPKTSEVQNIINKFKVLNGDPRSPTTGIERTPIVVTKIEEEESMENNVEEMSDDTLLKVLQSTNAELRQNIKKKPEGIMIYEDEPEQTVINVTPKKSKYSGTNGSRTPLSCMRNKGDAAHARSKSANTLHCELKEQQAGKTSKRMSHIPRLKSLSKSKSSLISGSSISLKNMSKVTEVTGDCENTPPNSHRDCWDKESSIVL